MKKNNNINEINNIKEKTKKLWTEKYRPSTIKDLVVSDTIKEFINDCIDKKYIPNLLLVGSVGTGKNSIVNVLLKSLPLSVLKINASAQRGIDVIRETVTDFISTSSFGNKQKIILLNEADRLTMEAQDSLRDLIEDNTNKCSFIFTGNYENKFSEALVSRCVKMTTSTMNSSKDIKKRLEYICEQENIDCDDDFLDDLIKKYKKDIRSMINDIQYSTLVNDNNIVTKEEMNNIFDLIFEKCNTVKEIQDVFKERDIIINENIYSLLYRYFIEKYSENTDCVICIAEYVYKGKYVFDQELQLMACLLTLKDILKEIF